MNLNILGQSFPISEPFAEGHVCTAPQARTLNQTRLENISNQLRAKLRELRDEGAAEGTEGTWDEAKIARAAEMVAKQDAEYTEFGMGRVGGGASVARDPVSSEARKLATEWLAGKLKEKGTTLAAQRKVNKEGIEAKIDGIAAHPKIVAQAEKIVAQRKKAASAFDDIQIGGGESAPEEAAA